MCCIQICYCKKAIKTPNASYIIYEKELNIMKKDARAFIGGEGSLWLLFILM